VQEPKSLIVTHETKQIIFFYVLIIDLNVLTIKVHEIKNVEATNPSGFVSCKFDVVVVFVYKEDKGKININKL
jgi:hypothetical protein